MGKKKSQSLSKVCILEGSSKKIPSFKRNEITVQCGKLFHLTSNAGLAVKLWDNYLETLEVLEKIKRLEGMKIKPVKRGQAIERFIEWLRSNGAKFEGISVQEFTGYDLGLQADKDLKENELILEIPRNLIFTASSELKALQTDPLIQHMPQVALAISLLIEKHKDNSKWKPYLDILPAQYNTVLYVSTNDMIELKGSLMLESALKQCRNIARQYAYFNRLFQNTRNPVSDLLRDVFTYEEYRWAVSTVMTRQNVIPNDDETQMVHALIPLWDMCNHDEGKITTDFNKTLDSCQCYAMRDFSKNDQIFIYYGPRTNSDFFVHSGFVFPENKSDFFKLRLGVGKADPLQKDRIELLDRLGIPSAGEFVLKTGSQPFSDMLLGFLRVISMSKDMLEHWLQSEQTDHLLKQECELDETVDFNFKKYLETRLKILIANYPTTREDDLELLRGALPQSKRLVVQMRLTEKNILHNALDRLNEKPDLDNNC